MNWFKKLFSKTASPPSEDRGVLVNTVLAEAFIALRENYSNKCGNLIILLGAITLQYNGEIILNKDFVDIFTKNENLTLEWKPLEDGNVRVFLVDKTNESK